MGLDEDLVSLANDALARMGGGSIGLDDESDLASLCERVTPQVVNARLTMQAWRFATFTFELTRDDTQGYKAGFTRAFRLPGGRLMGPLRVMPMTRPDVLVRDFRVENDFLFCDEDAVYASFIMPPPVGQWPPLFREAVTLILAHQFALSIPQKLDFADRFHQMAYGLPSERMQGGAWGAFVKAEAMAGNGRGALGDQSFMSAAHGGGRA